MLNTRGKKQEVRSKEKDRSLFAGFGNVAIFGKCLQGFRYSVILPMMAFLPNACKASLFPPSLEDFSSVYPRISVYIRVQLSSLATRNSSPATRKFPLVFTV